jgi:hypothetical protein
MNNQTRADGQVPLWSSRYSLPHLVLDLRTKEGAVGRVNSTVHEAVAVRGRNNTVLCNSQQIALLNRNLRERRKRLGPGVDYIAIGGAPSSTDVLFGSVCRVGEYPGLVAFSLLHYLALFHPC